MNGLFLLVWDKELDVFYFEIHKADAHCPQSSLYAQWYKVNHGARWLGPVWYCVFGLLLSTYWSRSDEVPVIRTLGFSQSWVLLRATLLEGRRGFFSDFMQHSPKKTADLRLWQVTTSSETWCTNVCKCQPRMNLVRLSKVTVAKHTNVSLEDIALLAELRLQTLTFMLVYASAATQWKIFWIWTTLCIFGFRLMVLYSLQSLILTLRTGSASLSLCAKTWVLLGVTM